MLINAAIASLCVQSLRPGQAIHMDGLAGTLARMVKAPDSEKLTINLGFVDLGHIDLMVRDGFYSNRSDFIRTAIRNQLATHADTARLAASRLTLELGLRTFTRQDLEAV